MCVCMCVGERSCCLVTKLCLTLCDPMDCSTPGFPVLHYLLEFAQTHVHWVGDAIQLSHPLLLPSLPALSISQHQVWMFETGQANWPHTWECCGLPGLWLCPVLPGCWGHLQEGPHCLCTPQLEAWAMWQPQQGPLFSSPSVLHSS